MGWRRRAGWGSISAARRAYLGEAAGVGLRIAAGAGLVAMAAIAAARAEAATGALAASGLGAVLIGWGTRGWSRAGRLRAHARACAQVKRALAPLAADGWVLTHSRRWPGDRRLDFLVITPDGLLGFVIGCVWGQPSDEALHFAHEAASWLATTTRGYASLVAVAGVRGVERIEAGVACISPDRLGAGLHEGWVAFIEADSVRGTGR